ncbi:large ribosomal subunit protein bL27m isoform X2 [Calonectris borealis]|uniref:large ribosomal subunit protein bL27m isoform X2 n=1 Tax=Calonectris borealis TaxID=1323832 RepID=UPI003F4B5F93
MVLTTPQTSLIAVRCASKKTGGSSKNLGGRSPGKRYGFKKVEGAFVHAGNTLATQRLIRWHPGAHVLSNSRDPSRGQQPLEPEPGLEPWAVPRSQKSPISASRKQSRDSQSNQGFARGTTNDRFTFALNNRGTICLGPTAPLQKLQETRLAGGTLQWYPQPSPEQPSLQPLEAELSPGSHHHKDSTG